MATSYAVVLPVGSIAIDTLDGKEPPSVGTGMVIRQSGFGREHAKRLRFLTGRALIIGLIEQSIHAGDEIGRNRYVRLIRYHLWSKSGKVLGDLDLDVAEVSLSRGAFPLLLVRVVGFGGSGGSAFQSAVPVMRNEGLALVALGRAVRIDIVNMGKVGLESRST